MIATWIPGTANGTRSFVVFIVIESRMSGGPSPSHVAEATQEMPPVRHVGLILLQLVLLLKGGRLAIGRFGSQKETKPSWRPMFSIPTHS